MAEVTVSQEALEKLKTEVRQFKKSRRFLVGVLTLYSLALLSQVFGSVFTKETCSGTKTAMGAVTMAYLFAMFYTNLMVLELKRTIVQLFQNK
jgi:hypothetical protein